MPSVVSRETAPSLIVLLVALFAGANLLPFGPVGAEAPLSSLGTDSAATPVPVDAGESDPLDGDPLDGQPPSRGDHEREDLVQLEFTRSGRPVDAAGSQPAYDGSPQTVWPVSGDETETWVWFDLGADHPLREVRWLARGAGTIAVDLSNDRRDWRKAGSREVRDGWQELTVNQDARYVRLTLTSEDTDDPPVLAEVAAYGLDNGDLELAQRAREDKSDKEAKDRDADKRGRARDRSDSRRDRDRSRDGAAVESVDGVSVEPGETRCRGKRAKCEAREGRVQIDEDCQLDGTCVIDIQANGGAATCDASGSDDSTAGQGEGKRGAEGGRCEATANGGTVTIGDIDP